MRRKKIIFKISFFELYFFGEQWWAWNQDGLFNSYLFLARRKNWVLRPAHEWLITFLSYLLIDRSLSNCRKRGFCLISKLGLWLFWVDQFQKLCAYMKLLCIRHPFQLLYKEKSNFCNSEFLDKFDWKQPECHGWPMKIF